MTDHVFDHPIAEFFALPDGGELFIEVHFTLNVPDWRKSLAISIELGADSDIEEAVRKQLYIFKVRFRSHVNKWIGAQKSTRDILAGSASLEESLKSLDLSDLAEEVRNVFVTDIHITESPTSEGPAQPKMRRPKESNS